MPGPGHSSYVDVIYENAQGVMVVRFPDEPWVNARYRGAEVAVDTVRQSEASAYIDTAAPEAEHFARALYSQLNNTGDPDSGGGGSAGTEGSSDGPLSAADILGATGDDDPAAKPVDPAVSQAQGFYLSLWGVSPPKGYVEQFFKAGGDFFDFKRAELSRPGAKTQSAYQDTAYAYANRLQEIFGRGF